LNAPQPHRVALQRLTELIVPSSRRAPISIGAWVGEMCGGISTAIAVKTRQVCSASRRRSDKAGVGEASIERTAMGVSRLIRDRRRHQRTPTAMDRDVR
jgi:hypothetical protein